MVAKGVVGVAKGVWPGADHYDRRVPFVPAGCVSGLVATLTVQ